MHGNSRLPPRPEIKRDLAVNKFINSAFYHYLHPPVIAARGCCKLLHKLCKHLSMKFCYDQKGLPLF